VKPPGDLNFDAERVGAFLATLEAMAGGEVGMRLPISPRHDVLDAIAHGINVLVSELGWVSARVREAEEQRASELRSEIASAEARSGALLKAIPDLMFVLRRDGTYLDYQARDPQLLFAPPNVFLGRTVREIMPPALAEAMMEALDRACRSAGPIMLEYELPMDELRFFETRIVHAGGDQLVAIVRDVTEAKRESKLVRDLAGRLIARQEAERQRIARELHDDISQRISLLTLEIDETAAQLNSDKWRAHLRKLSALAAEIAGDVHQISYALHPSRLRALGLIDALRSLCAETSQQRQMDVRFTHGALPQLLDVNVSLCLYRIAQEALHNVIRHSGAREAQVTLSGDETHVALRVTDSGVGFNPGQLPSDSLGLASMQERVAYLKGRLVVDAMPGEGTRISVDIPIEPLAAIPESSSVQSA